MTKLTIKTGTEEDFFKRGRQLAKAADRDQQLADGELTQDQLRANGDTLWGVVKELQFKIKAVK